MKISSPIPLLLIVSLSANMVMLAFLGYKYLRREPNKEWQDYTLRTSSWQDSVAFFRLVNEKNPGKILLVGDSMFRRLPLEQLWPECKVGNRGIGYDNTRALLRRLDDTVLSAAPHKVILYIGGNDISKRNDLKAIIEETERIMDIFAEHHIDTLFVSLLPRGKGYEPSQRTLAALNKDTLLFNKAMRVKCPEHHARFIDVAERFTNGEGFLAPDLTSDWIHLNAKGLSLFADLLEPYVTE